MSIIIQETGLLTILQTLDKEKSTENHEYNGACDRLAHQLANTLVGNDITSPTIEMTIQPATIKFTEPTIVAYAGADYLAKCDGKTIHANRIYLFDRGDVLEFGDSPRGNRIYLAVAGGLKVEENHSNILHSGDEVIMCREYTDQHHELFNVLKRDNHAVKWGVDVYALVEVYISDLFHIVKRPDVPDSFYETIEDAEYTVVKEKNRVSLYLEGSTLDIASDDVVHPGVNGGIYIADNQPVVALNDFNQSTSAPHIGTIPQYHMHKLAQKRRGSKIKFKVIDCDDAHANLYAHHLWVLSLFKAINYKLSKELVKEKM